MPTYSRRCSPAKRAFAKVMRKHPTYPEKLLWAKLKSLRRAYHLRRQIVILGFIVDFYCPRAKLIIECDGKLHNKKHDAWRDAIMAQKGFRVLRFTNAEITHNPEKVCLAIGSQIRESVKAKMSYFIPYFSISTDEKMIERERLREVVQGSARADVW